MDLGDLIKRGLAVVETPLFSEAIRGAGHYDATNGYSYDVAWNNGQMEVANIGFSPAYRLAEREWERLHGAHDDTNDAAWELFLLVFTGLA